jgi:hypothetical protein
MTIRYPTAALIAVLLAGCGGANGTGIGPGTDPETAADPGETALGPVEVVLGDLPPGFSARYDAATDTVTVDDGTGPVTLSYVETQGPKGTAGPFEYYAAGGNPRMTRLLRGRAASGGGVASVHWTDEGMFGTILARQGDLEMPGRGTAAFSGGYHGRVVGGRYPLGFSLTGAVALDADFDAGTISGAITDRSVFGTPAAPVILRQAVIVDGAFAGTTTGGGLGATIIVSTPGTTAAPGSHVGLFAADGREIIGAIRVPHDEAGRPLTEYGAFVAEQLGP